MEKVFKLSILLPSVLVMMCRLAEWDGYHALGGGRIVIEDGCYICHFFSAMAADRIIIKKNTLIASYVAVIGENHSIDPESGLLYGHQSLIGKPVTIGENCWIGEKVVVLPGVTIGDWCVIGACSLVNQDIPPYSIAVGNPARVIKKYDFASHSWVKLAR